MERVNDNNVITIMDGEENPNYEVNRKGEIFTAGTNIPKRVVIVSGRRYIYVKVNNENKSFQVGRIVLESFIGKSDIPGYDKVGFRDGDCGNNDIANLFWTDKRKWWLDELTIISDDVINKIVEASNSHPHLEVVEIAKKINVPKDLISYVLFNVSIVTADEPQNEVVSIDVTNNEPQDDSDASVEHPYNIYEDAKFEEIFGITVSLGATYNKILSDEIPALEYAGINQKKIEKYVLYKYGKEVYEYFKEKQLTVQN